MTGEHNGVVARLKRVNKVLLNFHCICHRLALACADTGDSIKYIVEVEHLLKETWKFFFENSPKRTSIIMKEIGPSDGGVGAPKKPSAFQKFFMAEKLSNYIRKRRNRSSTSSGGETSPFQEAKKPRDLTETEDESTGSDHETNDKVMAALDKIEHIGEQLNSIIDRLSKLDSIKSTVRNIETNLANLKTRTAKLEEFQATAKTDIADLKKSCSFNTDKCKEYRDDLKKKIDKQNELPL